MTEREESERGKQECWALMSRSERVLLILLVLTIILLVAAFVVIVYFFLTAQNICETPSCIKAASELIDTIDFTVHPCEDFYNFVCGNYPLSNEKCEEQKRLKQDVVLNALSEEGSSDILKVAQEFHEACNNITAIGENSTSTMLSIIKRIGGWPLLWGQKWNEDNFHFLKLMVNLRHQGFKYDWFIKFDHYTDTNGTNLLLITPPDLEPIASESDYLQGMNIVGRELGSSSITGYTDMTKVLNFQQELTDIVQKARQKLSKGEEGPVEENVEVLNKLWQEVKLVNILNSLTGGYATFTNTTKIMIAGDYYIYQLNILLGKTSRRTQADYIIWKIIESFLPFCSDNLRNALSKYYNLPNREDYCLTETTVRFHNELEIYVGTKEKNDEIIDSINLMTELIKNEIGEETKDIESRIIGINNPSVTESKDTFKLILEVNKWKENTFYNCLHKKSSVCSTKGYHHNPRHVEIFFDVDQNSIDIPFVLLHSDWYRWDQPNYINYARLGRTLADVFIEAVKQRNKTLEEDITGVEVAYRSYTQWVRNSGKERRLPAIKYSINQMFWIHSSSMFCPSNDSLIFEEILNSTSFNQDFNCENNCAFCIL